MLTTVQTLWASWRQSAKRPMHKQNSSSARLIYASKACVCEQVAQSHYMNPWPLDDKSNITSVTSPRRTIEHICTHPHFCDRTQQVPTTVTHTHRWQRNGKFCQPVRHGGLNVLAINWASHPADVGPYACLIWFNPCQLKVPKAMHFHIIEHGLCKIFFFSRG